MICSFALSLGPSCTKKEPAPRRTAPWLRSASSSSSGASASASPRTFRFAKSSSVRFSVSGRRGKVSGVVPLSGGQLRLDAGDLKNSSASVDVDLTALRIDSDEVPAGVDLGGRSPSSVALDWLELGSELPAERRAPFAMARFELSSVDELSAPSLALWPTPRRPAVRATAAGTLLVHGYRAPVRARVVLESLGPAQDASTDAPARLSIRSAVALVVPLAPHDIVERSPAGVVQTLGAERVRDFIGKNVRIEFELLAEAEDERRK